MRAQTAGDKSTISFARLGVEERSLRGPFDATYVDFSLPNDWELGAGAALKLQFNTFFARGNNAGGAGFGGTLRVVLNGVTLNTILLDQTGERTLEVPLTSEALEAVRADGRHVVGLLLDTNEQCGEDQFTSVIIRPASALELPHRRVAPPTDLARLPQPIFQRSFTPDAAVLVVPDRPSTAEMQAALAVVAGFGRMTSGGLSLTLTPAGRLDAATRRANHLIVVGQASSFPLLGEAKLPAPPRGDGFDAPGAQPDDGIIQMAVSPWNNAKVLLVAGGASDAAVRKAGQALSGGAVQTGVRPDLAVVAEVQPGETAAAETIDQTFADLGYDSQRMSGLGGQYAGYQFVLPDGRSVGQEAYLDLVFVHAALLDYDQSSVTVSLNDEQIGSVRLDDTSTRLGSARLVLPAGLLRPGVNQLTVRADLIPRAVCADPRAAGLWMVIRPESLLHLPAGSGSAKDEPRTTDLRRYPLPFSTGQNLAHLALVLQPDDPAGWAVAGQLVFDLGQRMQGQLADLVVAYGDAVPEPLRKERDLLLVGRPSALPLVGELASVLPAPFPAGSDFAQEPDAPVSYRLAPGTSLGYLQIAPSPWNKDRTILAVLGSTTEGLEWAGAALTTPRLRGTLRGNLAVINGEQIRSSELLPRATQPLSDTASTEPTPTPATGAARPATLLLAAGGVLALLLLGGGVALWIWWRRRSRRATPSGGGDS
ncbi:MAG: cellulose biosynthesis cyclic di-GMP-binding regulatory protein BcsB [Roseiflexaceae bacterium]